MKIPQSVGRYRIDAEIGRGGMGCVFRAHDPSLDRWVAVKIIEPTLEAGPDSEEMKKRFLREARLAAKLHHPGIVTVFDAGIEDGLLWLVMELVQGESLSQRLNRGSALDRAGSLEIIAHVADALHAAHTAGVVHRDIKPANILLLPDGTPKVTDFGVARAVGDNTALTRTGASVGSPSYMAPEQVRGEPVDARADLFSLGVVAYQLLLKRRPFPAETITTLIYQILNHDPFVDGQAQEDLGPEIVAFLKRALAKDRDDRFPDAESMASSARSLIGCAATTQPSALETDPTFIQQPQPVELTNPNNRRHRNLFWAFAGVAAVLLAAVTGLSLWTFFTLRSARQPENGVVMAVETTTSAAPGAAQNPLPTATAPILPTLPAGHPADSISSKNPVVDPPVPTVRTIATPRPQPTRQPAPNSQRENLPTIFPEEPSPTAVPPTPLPTAPPVPTVAPTPTSPPISEFFSCSRGAEFDVDPEEALVTINGTVLGIADDWDDAGGGDTYFFPGPGKYLVELSHPKYMTAWVEISVSENAEKEVIEVDTELKKISKAKRR